MMKSGNRPPCSKPVSTLTRRPGGGIATLSPAVPTVLLLLLTITLGGCVFWLQPGSQGYDHSKHVWTSTDTLPKTVRLVDTRSDEVLWEIDIPADHWLVTRIKPGRAKGGDPQYPDLMKFRIVEANRIWAHLPNKVDVPPEGARRWESIIREEAAAEPDPSEWSLDEPLEPLEPIDEDWPAENGGGLDEPDGMIDLEGEPSEEPAELEIDGIDDAGDAEQNENGDIDPHDVDDHGSPGRG